MELIPPTVRERRFNRLGPRMTSHATTMMITRTMGINSSTGLPWGKIVTMGNSTVVDGRG